MAVIEIRKNVRYGGKSIYCGSAIFERGIHPVRIAGFLHGSAELRGGEWRGEAEVWSDDTLRFNFLKSLAYGCRNAETLIGHASGYKAVYSVICR